MTSTMKYIALSIGASPTLSIVVKTTVILAMALLAVRLARRARASLRHAILASAFAAILALPVLTILLPEVQVSIASVDAGRSAPQPAIAQLAHVGQQPARPAPDGPAPNPSIPIASLLLSAWALGGCLVLSPVAAALLRLRRLRRAGLSALDMFPVVNELLRDSDVNRRVDVVVHEDILVPMTYGILRPTIVLPVDADRWSVAECRDALVHELEHIRRWDWLVHLMARVTCSVYWFHPLAWMAWRQMTLDAEQACDDTVVQRADGAAYAHRLVSLAQRLSARAVMPALSMARRRDLSVRVSAILNQDQARGRIGGTPRTVIVSATAVIVLAVSVLHPVSLPVVSTTLLAQPSTNPSFDVTSVRLNRSGDTPTSLGFQPNGRFRAVNELLWRIIGEAYQTSRLLWPFQILNIPDAIVSQRFDIEAVPGGTPTTEQRRLMLQNLLADRFKLQVHRETREGAVYYLVKARADGRLGDRLKPSVVDCSWARTGGPAPPPPAAGQPRPCVVQFGNGRVSGDGRNMAEFAAIAVTPFVERVVIDRTGLEGAFQWTLEWTPDPGRGAAASPDAVPFFTALQEQLGLRLEPGRGPIEVVVVDHAEMPKEN